MIQSIPATGGGTLETLKLELVNQRFCIIHQLLQILGLTIWIHNANQKPVKLIGDKE